MMRFEFAAYVLTVMIFITGYLWPASYWYEIHGISVPDAPAGSVKVYVDRTIHRAFPGAWSANVRDVEGAILEGCTGVGQNEYKPGAKAGDTMQWWVSPTCFVPPGEWILEIEIRNSIVPFFEKITRAKSNVFVVAEPDEPAPSPRVLKRQIDQLERTIQEQQKAIRDLSIDRGLILQP